LTLAFGSPLVRIAPDPNRFRFSRQKHSTGRVTIRCRGQVQAQFGKQALVNAPRFQTCHLGRPHIKGKALSFKGGGTTPWDDRLVKHLYVITPFGQQRPRRETANPGPNHHHLFWIWIVQLIILYLCAPL
jgi:hypothetical protein